MFVSQSCSLFTHRQSVHHSVESIHMRHKRSWVKPIAAKAYGIVPHERAGHVLCVGAHV
jgi:hypothetical protein